MNYQDVIDKVQHNCHIADARFAGEYTLCIYLLKMREYFRWEKQYPYGHPLPNADIGTWLTEREQHWHDLDSADYQDLSIQDKTYSPFDSRGINEALKPYGLVYSGGLGQHGRPHFFLAELTHDEKMDDYQIYVADKELARDLTAPPAMSLDKTIYIRRESLRRMLWERLEEWRWRKHEGAMSRALAYYDFESNLDQALDEMTQHETDVLMHHEIGEIHAGKHLGKEWQEMLFSMPRSAAELMSRAIRDHIADCCITLPELIKQERYASVHFYFGNFQGMRKKIFPALPAAYQRWHEQGNLDPLLNAIEQGEKHWTGLANEILDIYRQQGEHCQQDIVKLVEDNLL